MQAFLQKANPNYQQPQQQMVVDSEEQKMESAKQKPKYTPWIEKYRPTRVDEVSHQVECVNALRQSVATGQVPHLLMYGPPGTGKTSIVLALARDMFGSDFYRQRVLELNASDERGIQVIRDKVKKFAQKKLAKHPGGRNVPNIQIIILDEADSMTHDAQAALRRIIENHATTTRFCIICNYISKIIDPLASRCVKFRFSPIGFDAQMERLALICDAEQVNLSNQKVVLTRLIQLTEGDLRRSINLLQTCSSFARGKKGGLTADDIENVSGVVPDAAVTFADETLRKPNTSFSSVQNLAEELILEGYDCQQLLNQLLEHYIIGAGSKGLPDVKKARISEIIASTDFNLLTGGNEELNLLNALSHIDGVLKKQQLQ